MMQSCSIIIRSFNEEKYIGKLLDGIKKQVLSKEVTLEIIVVDSGSTDNTIGIAKKFGAKIVSISKDEFSFGRALNRGILEANGNIILIASAHVYPLCTNWLEKILAPFSDNKICSVYGRQVGNEITKFSENRIFQKWFPPMSNYMQINPFCNNANCAIRKELWNEVSYNEQLTGLEDLDWAKRMLEKGFYLAYEAEAVIVHVHEESFSKIKNRYQREAIAFKKIIPSVHVSFLNFLYLFVSNVFWDVIYAIKNQCFIYELANIVKFRYNQFYGTYLGHLQYGEVSQELKYRFYYPENSLNSKKQRFTQVSEKFVKYEANGNN